jgi:hypothetical protein
MKKLIFLAVTLPFVLCAQQKITLEDLWVKYAFFPKFAEGFNLT